MRLPLYSGGKAVGGPQPLPRAHRGLLGCPGISDSTALTPAVPRSSAVGVVPFMGVAGICSSPGVKE